MRFAQHLVSKKKRRYQKDGFDLDLAYITDNIIAMGFPSEGKEAIYRNSMKETKKFLEAKASDHYKVYNLCSEHNRVYDHSHFHGRVAKFSFPDHNAPPFGLIQPFCEDVQKYLAEDPSNVAAIHCKAGKGRTGVMISAFLMHIGKFTDSKDALEFYGNARTKDGKGVTIPSQTRYVHYYGEYLSAGKQYQPVARVLREIRLVGIPKFKKGTCYPFFTVREGPSTETGRLLYQSQPNFDKLRGESVLTLKLNPPVTVENDVKVEFFHYVSKKKCKKMCYVWFNTFFVKDTMVAEKHTIDKAASDKKCKYFPQNFRLEFDFEPIVEDIGGTKPTEIKEITNL